MALLVHDNGELQSLRYLVNSHNRTPKNLILKLYSSNTTPVESDVPSQLTYYEPYDSTGLVGYGTAPSTGYPPVINNRNDEDYSSQFGILLDGSRWNIRTITTPIKTTTGSGNVNEYTITVASATQIAVGHYVSGGGVGANATVAAIDGNTIVLTVKNVSTFSNQTLQFGVGTTTASYPEQIFTFTSAANNQFGYCLVRANNLPIPIHGVEDAISVSTGSTISKNLVVGTVGVSSVVLFEDKFTPTSVGVVSTFNLTTSTLTGITTGQRVIGSNIATAARVVGTSGTDTVILDKRHNGTVSGVTTFFVNVTENITLGMGVTHGTAPGEVNAIPAGTVVTGLDELTRVVYLSNPLANNIQSATGNTIFFNFSRVNATNHGLVPGDVVYVATGTGNTVTVSSTYTVFESPTTNTFTTTPAMAGIGSASIYSAILFAERFTNGPYNIQNNGDQIKVTLNISLD
jgi:hypothetical protein